MRLPLSGITAILFLLSDSSICLAQEAATAVENGGWATAGELILLLLPVLAIFVAAFFYLRHLQRIYYQSCVERFQLDLFAKSALGLPEGTIGAIMRLMLGALLIYFVTVVMIKINVSGAPFLSRLFSVNGNTPTDVKDLLSGIGAILFLLLIIVGAVYFMQRLQTRFFDGCIKTGQLDKFFDAPAGLPEGTIRSMLAMMIVAVSLFFIVFQFFFDKRTDIPQGLMTLLTAVVAFYFANRAGTTGAADAAARQTQGLRNQRDEAIKQEQQTKADSVIGKVQKALQVTNAASAFLPPEQRKKYESLAEKLQTGLSAAEGLLKRDNPAEAVTLVSGALGEFGRANPAFQAVAMALPEFTRVLGIGIPALGLISAVVSIGVRIGTARYERWKLRILQAPIDAAELPIQPIDGLMAERLLRANPELAQAFMTELNAGNSAALADIVNAFIRSDTQVLWTRYRFDGARERFESQAVFEGAVQALRRRLGDNELRPYVEPAWLGPTQTYDTLVAAVDKLHEDDQARARLDALILVTDGLKSQGQPVLQIMEKIEEELKKDEGKP
jgi:Ca2+/Na+ antiporter